MKKIILLITILMLVGCSKKADTICTQEGELFTTKVELFFENNILTNATSISEYESENLANQICSTLGDKVKCYENKVEIIDYIKPHVGKTKNDVIKTLNSQGFICK